MFKNGFLGTKAPLFIDIVTTIVVLLPFLLYISILFAKQKRFKLHKETQIVLFIITISVLFFFEYGVRADGGVKKYLTYTDIPDSLVIYFLAFHITISSIAVILWGVLLYLSLKANREGELVGNFSAYHKKLGRITNISIIITAITGFGVYYILFI